MMGTDWARISGTYLGHKPAIKSVLMLEGWLASVLVSIHTANTPLTALVGCDTFNYCMHGTATLFCWHLRV